MTNEAAAPPGSAWFNEEDGQRKGPISDSEMIDLIKSSRVSYGSAVWEKDFPDWLKVENTELRVHLADVAPPPLSGEHVKNTVVWVLAFAPLIGLFLEYMIATVVYGNQYVAQAAVQNNKLWLVTVALNIGLSYFDERRLKRAGHNTDKFKGWVWIVPVYLYQRYRNLRQGPAYFIVWLVCFGVTLLD